MKLNYKWFLKNGYENKNGLKVFSCFACGGGSSMGYKLAGFDVIGANDIDDDMERVYKQNHNPKYYFKMPVLDLLQADLPDEMYNLDILDGSPPCSTFSMAGSREKNWGKEKMFREGQSKQILDDLFFDFIKVVKKLQPKVVIAENVKGMLNGDAKGYLLQINREFERAGYKVQLFCLNAASMGVPQKRERIFFICHRKDLDFPKIKLDFNERTILLGEVSEVVDYQYGKELSEAYAKWWRLMGSKSGSFANVHPKGSFFNTTKCSPHKVLNTITATSGAKLCHWNKPNELSNEVLSLCNSFPVDYNYLDIEPKYLIGMSVPPIMIAKIANQIKLQWLKK